MEGTFLIYNLFEKVAEYEKDRVNVEKFNDKESDLKKAREIVQEDAEALINEIDLAFESHFDANLRTSMRKESSIQNFAQGALHAALRPQKGSSEDSAGGFGSANTLGGGNLSPFQSHIIGSSSQGNLIGKPNRALAAYKNLTKELSSDYRVQVPPNCSLLEVVPIFEGVG
jgi:hypothetical protein